MKHVSGIALPDKYDDIEIKNEDIAWDVAVTHSETQLKRVASKFNMNLTCELWCDSDRRVYRFTFNDNSVLSKYVYKPEGDIIAFTDWSKLVKVETPDLLQAKIRGFVPVWKTEEGNMWITHFYSNPHLDENGKIKYSANDEGLNYPLVDYKLYGTEFGRDLMRVFNDDNGYLYSGNDGIYPGYFSFKGTLYSYILENDRTFIEYELKN